MMSARTPWQRRIDRVLMGAALVLTLLVLQGVGNLDQDDKRIDRGQLVTNCTGTLSDLGADWQLVALGEFLTQVEAVASGEDVDVTDGQTAVDNARILAALRRQARTDADAAIDADETEFVCPPVDPRLEPPPPPTLP